jgi:SAM-dependent methyltransferase
LSDWQNASGPGLRSSVPASAQDSPPFDSFAHAYDQYGDLAERLNPALRAWIAQAVADAPGLRGRAVDAGCGTGRFTTILADAYQRVDAADISTRMIDVAVSRRSRPNIGYQVGDLMALSTKQDGDGPAGLVLTVNAAHHAGPPQVVLPHLRGLLADGGTLIAVDIVAEPDQWTDPEWHIDRAFTLARAAYRTTGDYHRNPQIVLDLFLHPQWLEMVGRDIPLSRAEFHRHYQRELPGVAIIDMHEVMAAAVWHHPGPATGPGSGGVQP